MTREETKKILMVIQSSFPNWKPQGEMSFLADTWTNLLNDYSYSEISLALKDYIITETVGFAPSIGQLIGRSNKLKEHEKIRELECILLGIPYKGITEG